ncbi:DUF6492 family protein [Candidatus Methylopumilus universalis]|uniref:DUF6492 family protein n=1 Tax=Candidatus Methylopumilus universalis TaxID=2588536 RepID=UPI003BEEDA1D
MIDVLISVCKKRDIFVWKYSSSLIVQYIRAKKYIVIVPDVDFIIFKNIKGSFFEVHKESEYIGNLQEKIKLKLPEKFRHRTGWYLQQFVKLKAIESYLHCKLILIWDADTIPLKKIKFNRHKKIIFIEADEFHLPYFKTIEKLLTLSRKQNFSFISQSFPIKTKWARAFFKYVENKHKKNWESAIIDSIIFSNESSFSEYETLGTFIYHKYKKEFTSIRLPWLRYGIFVLDFHFINKLILASYSKYYDFICVEHTNVVILPFVVFKYLILRIKPCLHSIKKRFQV